MNKLNKYFTDIEIRKLREYKDSYNKALFISNKVFKDTYDKGGNPYMEHLYSVSDSFENEDYKVVGLLHDIIEDKNFTEEDLLFLGFSKEQVEAVSIVTKKDKEKYSNFIDRIIDSNNDLAIQVKFSDMTNNMDVSRMKDCSIQEKEYVKNKYENEYKKLIKKMEEIK